MKQSILLPLAFLLAIFLVCPLSTVQAAIITSGNISPSDPAAWTVSTSANVGNYSGGTLTVNGGTDIVSGYGAIGRYSGATSMATVDGPGSTWTNRYNLNVGWGGSGTLKITNGGTVTSIGANADFPNTGGDNIGFQTGSTGTATVDGSGSTWTNRGLSVGSGGGRGTLEITKGGVVSSGYGYIGTDRSNGTVTVDGFGSKWTITENLYVGSFSGSSGTGTLNITNSGTVSDDRCYIGWGTGSKGTVTVDGPNSKWNSECLYLGLDGSGTLKITNGGTVTTKYVSIRSASLLAMDVGNRSLLSVNGDFVNYGTVSFAIGAGAVAGATYTPIQALTWSGTGRYQTIGGTWSTGNHTFTASSVASGTVGSAVTIDLATTQRILVTDSSGESVGASFAPTAGSTSLSFTATAISGTTSSSLQVTAGGSILSSWMFSATGYTTGTPVYLSFLVGSDYSLDDLDVWHFDDATGWTEYATTDLTYDGAYASFTVTGFSGYAVTEAIPEPGTLALLAAGLVGLAAYSRRKRK